RHGHVSLTDHATSQGTHRYHCAHHRTSREGACQRHSVICALWGGRPRPQPAPWPARLVQGDPRRPGGLPYSYRPPPLPNVAAGTAFVSTVMYDRPASASALFNFGKSSKIGFTAAMPFASSAAQSSTSDICFDVGPPA